MSNVIKPQDTSPEARAIEMLTNHKDLQVRMAAKTLTDSSTRRGKILTLVKAALQQLRLDMKYLMFDLEATRRERDVARRERDVARREYEDCCNEKADTRLVAKFQLAMKDLQKVTEERDDLKAQLDK